MNAFEIIYCNPITGKPMIIFNILNDINNKYGGDDLELFDIYDDNKIQQKKPDKKLITEKLKKITVNDIIFFPEDTFYDLKIKIFIIFKKYLNIELYPFLQHLYIRPEKPIQLLYKIPNVPNININIHKEKIENIPIDINIYNNRDSTVIIGKDNEYTLSMLEYICKDNKIYIINLLDYDLYNIGEFIKNDESQINIIYYSFINIYFPMINLEIFNYLLGYIDNISFKYPDMFLNYTTISEIYTNQIKFLNDKYIHLQNKNGKYNKYINLYNPFLVEKKSSLLTILIKKVKIDVVNKAKYNLQNLFNLFDIDKKYTILLKQQNLIMKQKKTENIKLDSIVLSFIKKINNCVVVSKYNNNISYHFIISNYPKYIILCNYNETSLTLQNLYNDIDKEVNIVVDKVNKLGRDVLITDNRMAKLKYNNYIIQNIDIKIKFLSKMTPKEYGDIINSFDDDINIKINKRDTTNNEILDYIYIKSPVTISDNIFELSDITNTYTYLWDIEHASIINEYLDYRHFIIDKKNNEFVVEINKFSINDFKYFYQYLTFKIFNVLVGRNTNFKASITNNKQKLKYFDPVLMGDKVLPNPYSRICQGEKIPIGIHGYEYNTLTDKEKLEYTEYWNFTNNTPAYYKCNNLKYKDLNFMTNKHPDNYCIPCCKIKYEKKNKDIVRKKENVYKSCIDNHIYIDINDNKVNRYISNYGEYIPPDRISHLPNKLSHYLQSTQDVLSPKYNIYKKYVKMRDPYATSLTDKKFPINKYMVDKILYQIRYRNSYEDIVDIYDYIDTDKLEASGYNILKIIENPELDIILYNKIKKIDPEETLIIYYNRTHNWKFLIFSKFLLARKYMLYKKTKFKSTIKFVTKKQLNNSIYVKDNQKIIPQTKEDVNDNYFLYGCENLYKNNDLPYLNIISFCMGISRDDLIQYFIKHIKKDNNLFYLLGKNILIFYKNVDTYLNILTSLLSSIVFIDNSEIIDSSFIELTRILFDCYILHIHDNNNSYDLIIDEYFQHIIPNMDTKIKFIIVFTNIVNSKLQRNVLVELILKEYYRTEHIKEKVFNNNSIFINVLKNKINKNLSTLFDFNFLKKFVNSDPNLYIKEIYTHKNNMVYAVKIAYNNNTIIIPIMESIIFDEYIISNIPKRKDIKYDYTFIKDIIEKINNYIYEISKKKIKIIKSNNPFYSDKENSVDSVIPFLKVKKLLNLKIKNVWNYVGVVLDIGNIYFKPIIRNKNNLEKMLKYFTIKYNILGVNTDIDFYLQYDPDYINNIIQSNKICNNKLEYTENIFGYELFTKTLLNHIDTMQNKPIRTKIKHIFTDVMKSKNKWDEVSKIEKLFPTISKNISNNDIKRISNLIKYVIDTKLNINILCEKFDKEYFDFDSNIWNNILKMTYKECHKEITKISNSIIVNKKYKLKNIPTGFLCSNIESNYCEKNKLILTNISQYITMFVEDLFNPTKRLILEKKILLTYNDINIYDIYKKDDEHMYIIK